MCVVRLRLTYQVEYIDLRGSSYDNPAVCKYTGERGASAVGLYVAGCHTCTWTHHQPLVCCVSYPATGNKYYSDDWQHGH